MDYTIAGHSTYDIYNYFQIQFFPCHNTTENGNHCEDIEVIENLLRYTGLTVKIQDVELTPENYYKPFTPRVRELTAPVMSSLYQNINAYFHIISIESDTDVLGFEALSKYSSQKAFKYDVTFIMTSTNSPTAIIDGNAYCDITIQLTEQVITIKRTYTKLIEALGDVGGLMEFLFSFFHIISTILTETLYEKDLVNSLFSFDLEKKIVLFKSIKSDKSNNNNQTIDSPQTYNYNSNYKNTINNNTINNNNFKNNNKIYNNEEKYPNKNNNIQELLKSNDVIIHKINRKRKSSINRSMISSQSSYYGRNSRYKINVQNRIKKQIKENNNLNANKNRKNSSDEKENLEKYDIKKIDISEESKENKNIIEKIKFEKMQFYLCFLCYRKFKIIQNILIDEGMKLISEELDIRHIFINMLRSQKLKENCKLDEGIKMSDNCENNISNLNKGLNSQEKSFS